MRKMRKMIVNALLALANGIKVLLILVVLIGGTSYGIGFLCDYIDSTETGKQWRVNQRYRTEMYEQKYPSAGATVVIQGKKYIVVRECWLGLNRYELRDVDGNITYATNEEW